MSSFFNEPKQEPNSQHILSDERSKAWVEVQEPKSDSYPARVALSVTWVAFSALAYKIVRALSGFTPVSLIVLCLGLLALPLAFLLYKRSQDESSRFSTLVYLTLVVLGIVIGGL